MTHQEAMHGKVIERYLLGELNEAERSEFESHYFACPECAEGVLAGARFVGNAKAPLLALDPSMAPSGRFWERWLAPVPKTALAGACGALGLALAWQIWPGPARPEVTGSYFVTATRTSGAPRKIRVAPGQERIALLFNHTDTAVVRLEFTLESSGGLTVLRFSGESPRDTNDIQVLVPVAGLPGGAYTLRVWNGETRHEVAALPFELVRP